MAIRCSMFLILLKTYKSALILEPSISPHAWQRDAAILDTRKSYQGDLIWYRQRTVLSYRPCHGYRRHLDEQPNA